MTRWDGLEWDGLAEVLLKPLPTQLLQSPSQKPLWARG